MQIQPYKVAYEIRKRNWNERLAADLSENVLYISDCCICWLFYFIFGLTLRENRILELCVLVFLCLIKNLYLEMKSQQTPFKVTQKKSLPSHLISACPVYLEKRQQVELLRSGWIVGDRQQEVTSRFIRLLFVFRLITTLMFPMAGTASPGSTPLSEVRLISAV